MSALIATRESYGKALAALGEKHENLVVLDADLSNATKTNTFKKAFPERHCTTNSPCSARDGKWRQNDDVSRFLRVNQ